MRRVCIPELVPFLSRDDSPRELYFLPILNYTFGYTKKKKYFFYDWQLFVNKIKLLAKFIKKKKKKKKKIRRLPIFIRTKREIIKIY
ncbi:hypothetical protein PUN28_003425 [Cardiocondyla obscurior]|uniref:Uncharacterized protein n=1 Tax=Cardiocondyla obscurior TaxID=286306 RepID=A0AAW2GN33_9HYME